MDKFAPKELVNYLIDLTNLNGLFNLFNTKKKNSTRFATTALKFIFVYLVLFSIAQYISFIVTGMEQSYLIESTFTVFGVELGGLLLKRVCDKMIGKKIKSCKPDNDTSENSNDIIAG